MKTYKHNSPTIVAILVAISFSPLLLAQSATGNAASALARSSVTAVSSDAASGSADDSTATMMKNFARVFQNRVSPSGVRFWSLLDADVKGKTQDQVLESLSPSAIKAGDHVRQMDIVVDLKEPLTVFAKPGQSISIGTAAVDGAGIQSITVTSIISTNGLTIISK